MNTRIELIKPVPSHEDIRIFSILGMEAGIVKNLSLFSSSIRSVMQKYLEERHEITFDKIFNQRIGKSDCSHGRQLILVIVLKCKCSP